MLTTFLGLTVVTTIGTLMGFFLKEWLFPRSFEDWKAKRSLESVYKKYKDPLLLSTMELWTRLEEICREHPAVCRESPIDYLNSQYLNYASELPTRSSAVDVHFNQYKLQSSVYRLCAFFGWVELFRQDLVFLYDEKKLVGPKVREALDNIRSDFADGQLNEAEDWEDWCDALIYREEQRAIGESMITDGTNGRVVLGYGEFSQLLNGIPPLGKSHWFNVAIRFLIDPEQDNDFRLIRLQRLVVHLADLIEALDSPRFSKKHRELRSKYERALLNPAA
jgi:hypothetical protein